ncbi:TetR/AcrR family transcriptional regulator [Nitratireductor sp. XY-223]|uniref:TetR/AcrR family transcriptional regulator n=1 Tax=Nitratireductor sp. XY-223 TaxID=2561926 RepID=UPI0010AB2AEC|nr:TetR/AcrR family transcriptional regulator [Nitratireductor sp. XY-223]
MPVQRDTRQHIISTSRDVILGRGFSAVGLSQLLNVAEVPKGSFYHYFKSKESFGEALLEDYFDNYLNRLDELLKPDGRPAADRIMAFWGLWTDPKSVGEFGARCLVVKLGAEVSDLSEPMRAVLRDGTERIVARLSQCLMEGMRDGSLPNDMKPVQAALALYDLWLGATLMTKLRHDTHAFKNALLITRQLLRLD